MKSMNLFGDSTSKATTKPKKKTYTEDFKKKAIKLAYQFGVTKAAEELGISTSSIRYWKKTLANGLPYAPIQDEEGNLIFNLEGRTYSLNVNSEEERERIKEEVNANSLTEYDWFKEDSGEKHWVFYNTKMYSILNDLEYCIHCLMYLDDSNLIPIIPINATSCFSMFTRCRRLTQIDLSKFNTSNIVNMLCMFAVNENITQLDLSKFDTSRVTNMSSMFSGCESLTQLDLSSFNTSQITAMYEMFENCVSLTQLDLSNFDTSQVTTMNRIFYGCYSLSQLDLSNFDTSNITTMSNMFNFCRSLTQLDISNFNTSKVTNMHCMFEHCRALTQLDLSSFDTSQVGDMSSMFYNCRKLTQLDLSNFDTSEVTVMDSMFEECENLTTIYVSNKWNTNSVKHHKDMFKYCWASIELNKTSQN